MQNKFTLFAGISLFLCFCLLSATGTTFLSYFHHKPEFAVMFSVILCFILPSIVLIILLQSCDKLDLPGLCLGGIHLSGFALIINGGIAVSALVVILNALVFWLSGTNGIDLSLTMVANTNIRVTNSVALSALTVVPAFCEEIFLRGLIFPIFKKNSGTVAAIVISSLCFAMLHANLHNFLGPFLAGCLFAYFTYIFHSIWPAIIAHVCSNLYYVLMNWLADTYASYGIWNVFLFINTALFLLFGYFFFRSLESMLENNKIPLFEKPPTKVIQSAIYNILNPTFFVFIFAFLAKAVFKII